MGKRNHNLKCHLLIIQKSLTNYLIDIFHIKLMIILMDKIMLFFKKLNFNNKQIISEQKSAVAAVVADNVLKTLRNLTMVRLNSFSGFQTIFSVVY